MYSQAIMALKVLVPAALVAGVIALVAWFPRPPRPALQRNESARPRLFWGGGWAAALALGQGFAVGFVIVNQGWPEWPLTERWMWLMPIAGAATLVGVIASFAPPRFIAQLAIAVLLAISLGGLIQPLPSIERPLAMRLLAGAAALLLWLGLEPLAKRRPGASLPLALWLVFAGLSIITLQARLGDLSLIASGPSAAVAAIALVALIQPRLSLARGGMHVVASLLIAMSFIGWMYALGDVTALHFALVAAAPLALWLGELPIVTRRTAWQAALIRLAIVAIPVGVAVGLTMIGGEDAGDDYPY